MNSHITMGKYMKRLPMGYNPNFILQDEINYLMEGLDMVLTYLNVIPVFISKDMFENHLDHWTKFSNDSKQKIRS